MGLDSNIFGENNYALYGKVVASYPIDLRVINYTNYPIASGQRYQGTIEFEIIDIDNQRVAIDTDNFITIEANSLLGQVYGETLVRTNLGYGQFNFITFQYPPGSQNANFKLSSTTINNDYITTILDQQKTLPSFGNINQAVIMLDFRRCLSGEININNQCQVCQLGTYSLKNDSYNCNDCLSNTDCLGGNQIKLKSGFWKSSFQSQKILKCFNDESCAGGIIDETDQSQAQIEEKLCNKFYSGNLCDSCTDYEGEKFTKLSNGNCGRCPPRQENLLKILGIALAIFLAVGFVIIINLARNTESQLSTISRIFMNYIQIVSSTSAYNLGWPSYVAQYLGAYQKIGEATQSFVSVDCILKETKMIDEYFIVYYLYGIILSIIPFCIIFAFAFIFMILKVIRNKTLAELKREIIVCILVVVYALHPTITKYSAGLFYCVELDDNEYWLEENLNDYIFQDKTPRIFKIKVFSQPTECFIKALRKIITIGSSQTF
eukprot:403365763